MNLRCKYNLYTRAKVVCITFVKLSLLNFSVHNNCPRTRDSACPRNCVCYISSHHVYVMRILDSDPGRVETIQVRLFTARTIGFQADS